MTSQLVLAQPQKSRKPLKRRVTSAFLSVVLIGTPVIIATNAEAFSPASALKYIQKAQKIIALVKAGKNGIGSLDIGNLGSLLSLFKDLNLQELDGVLKELQSQLALDPETKKLIGEYATTLGQLGVPIPDQVTKLVKTIAANNPSDNTSPFGLTQNQALLTGLNISTDTVTNSVLGEGGQQALQGVLNDSQGAWQGAKDIIQVNGGAIVEDSVLTAMDAQVAFSSQDVLKAISIQNAQSAVLTQQVGAANVKQGEISAMGVNLQAKDLVLSAQTLEVEQFQANQLAASTNAQQADTQGAFNGAITNAYMFSCLGVSDCKK